MDAGGERLDVRVRRELHLHGGRCFAAQFARAGLALVAIDGDLVRSEFPWAT